MKTLYKILAHQGIGMPPWAKNNTLNVPQRGNFVMSSEALMKHWASNPDGPGGIKIFNEDDQPAGFTNERNNVVFIRNSLLMNSLLMSLDAYYDAVYYNSNMTDLFDKALSCQKLVDIYKVTGTAMREFNQNGPVLSGKDILNKNAPARRSLRDCSDFLLIRAIHWASADKIGQLFPGSDDISATDRGHQVMQNTHLTGLGEHGFGIDRDLHGNMTPNLVYLKDDNSSAAFRISIEGGKLMWSPNPKNLNYKQELHTLDWVRTGKEDSYDNTAHFIEPGYHSRDQGVAGFCMTLNYQLFATKHQNVNRAEGRFFHSSYVAGNDILCTGCITVDNGTLIRIDNMSGHYKPSTEKLVLAIRHLQSQGVDVSELEVFAMANPVWQKATDLLANKVILSNTYNRPVPVHKSRAITAALQSYSSRWKTSVTASVESKNAIKNMNLRDGAGLVEIAMFYAYKSSTNTKEELEFLSGIQKKYAYLPLKDKSELRTRLQSVLGPNLKAAWAS